MSAVARMERLGVPIDKETLESFRKNWQTIQERLIESIDRHYGVYEGRKFKMDRWIDGLPG
jgi:DNA polymerase I-like protein with 3'-5' exonuclease and polymerase domains